MNVLSLLLLPSCFPISFPFLIVEPLMDLLVKDLPSHAMHTCTGIRPDLICTYQMYYCFMPQISEN